MTATEILQQIISILVGGITEVGSAIGSGISNLVQSIMFTGTGETQELSAFAIVTLVFSSIALAIGLCRMIVRFISTLGGSTVG